MDGNRNMRFPGQPPGNFNVMPHPQQQFVQQGMPMYPMMQQQPGMVGAGVPMMQHPGMFPMQGMAMRPGIRPPSYNQAMTENYRHRMQPPSGTQMSPATQKRMEEQERKDKKFQAQQHRLKQFSKAGPVDADKLIESMFGKTEKPKPVEKQKPPAPVQEPNDDAFGDFLGGPSVTSDPITDKISSNVTGDVVMSQSEAASEATPPQTKEEKKDLMAMMMECSDLTSQNKPKSFHHKTSLKDLHPTHHGHNIQTFNQSRMARQWKQEEDLTGLFTVTEDELKERQAKMAASAPPPKVQKPVKFELPSWCKDDEKVPVVYKQVLEAATVGGVILTDRLYPILVMSGLPKETLGQIWSLANQTTPGQLIKPELYLILALVAFAQNNYTSLTVDMLNKCPQPPVPFLGQQPTTSHQQDRMPQGTPPLPPQELPQMSNITQQSVIASSSGQPQFQNVGQPNVIVPPSGQPMFQNVGQQSMMATPTSLEGIQSMAVSNFTPGLSSSASPLVSSVSGPGTGVFPAPPGTTGGNTNPPNNQATLEEDFTDFQEAPPVTSGFVPPPKKTEQKPKEEVEYLYSAPKLTEEQLASELSPEMEHSNVQNFFGSDDSSVSASPQRHLITDVKGASTPNSLDDDFDDFKSADSKPSDSSQFTSSEQSENEDFKVFESYLDDFNKRKSDCQQESPLHRPIPKFTGSQVSQLPSTATVMAVPAVRNLWPTPNTKAVGGASTLDVDVKSNNSSSPGVRKMNIPTLGLSPPQSSDSDFADFQQAPVADQLSKAPGQLQSSQSDTCLIGDEDKYAAFRVLEINEEAPASPSVFESKTENKEAEVIDDEDNWADFQAVPSEKTGIDGTKMSTANENKASSLDLFDSKNNKEKDDWADFQGSTKTENSSEWSAFSGSSISKDSGATSTKTETSDWSAFPGPTTSKASDWSGLSSGNSNVTNLDNVTSDDWGDFRGTKDQSLTSNGITNSSKVSDTSGTDSASTLVHIKKSNLQASEIMGLFKVRDEPLFVPTIDHKNTPDSEDKTATSSLSDDKTDSKHDSSSTTFVQSFPVIKPKASPVLETNLDSHDDPFRVPPPMDDGHDEDDGFGEFSRGYDLEDIVHPPAQNTERKKNLYNFYGMGATSVKSSKKTANDNQTQSANQSPEQTDGDNQSGQDFEIINWNTQVESRGDDTQSISSLDFPPSKKVQNLKDLDSQSVSSGEYGNFETHLKPSINPESKSVDSLELKDTEAETFDQSDGDIMNGQTGTSGKEAVQTKMTDVTSTTEISQNPLPVLGDRYSSIMEDMPGSDKHAFEWQRCLENCAKMIKEANNIFNSISSSTVCNEVIRSEQGSEYVRGIVEIYRVVCRITAAMTATGLSTEKLKAILKEIDLAWNNLTAFLVGGNMMPDDNNLNFKNAVLKSDDTAAQYRACGVCLLNVDIPSKNFNCDDDCAKLLYGGRQYHAACANFWVNCVDSMLPALKLPELL